MVYNNYYDCATIVFYYTRIVRIAIFFFFLSTTEINEYIRYVVIYYTSWNRSDDITVIRIRFTDPTIRYYDWRTRDLRNAKCDCFSGDPTQQCSRFAFVFFFL